MPASLQDFVAGFDPTAQANISDVNLKALVEAATPALDAGLIKVTTDDGAGNPDVPNATATVKWQNYIWLRVQASSKVAYVWNPNAASDVTFLKWQPITVASVADGSITNSKLATAAVTDDKVAAVSYSKITGAPVALPPSGAAGGDLTGNYPNPSVGNNAVTSAKLQSDAAVDANRAVGTDHIKNNAVDFATKLKIAGVAAFQILRMNAGATAWEVVTKLITQLAEPTVTEELKSIRVKADASGFEYYGPTYSKIYTADDGVTIPANDTWSVFAHGLGVKPSMYQVFVKCVTGENGYSVGDIIPISNIFRATDISCPIVSNADATNINVAVASGLVPGAIRFVKKGDGSTIAALTRANWRFTVVAAI